MSTEPKVVRWRRLCDRGAATVEFAILAPFLVWFVLSITDLSDAFFRHSAAVDALRASAVVGFDRGNARSHDLDVLRTLINEADHRRISSLDKVVIYRASWRYPKPHVPCLWDEAEKNGGIKGICVVYDAEKLDLIREGSVEGFRAECPGSWDELWCGLERPRTPGWWTIGIHLEADQEALTGAIPGFETYKIKRSVVVWEAVRDY